MTTPVPTEPRNKDNPGKRLQAILSAPESDANAAAAPRPPQALPTKRPTGPTSGAPKGEKKDGKRAPRLTVQREKIAPAFWTIASWVSMTINVVMLIVVLALVQQLKSINELSDSVIYNVLGGLHRNFVKMDMAHIITTIEVTRDVPVNFTLPIDTTTEVVLTENTQVSNTTVYLNFIPVSTTITLPAGTRLPVALKLEVPVNTTIPIQLEVPVDIPLEKTDLHSPFVGLRNVVKKYHCLLEPNATLELDDGSIIDLCTDDPAE